MKKYPAKVLLFGEYLTLEGHSALAVPYTKYSGHWVERSDKDASLMEVADHISTLKFKAASSFDSSRFSDDINKGLLFRSTIPIGCGLGSSGALVAAIYDRYAKVRKRAKITSIKQDLASIEAFYHGKSSGTDPLVSYLGKPLSIHKKGVVVLANTEFPKFELLDSGQERNSREWISRFHVNMQEESFAEPVGFLGKLNDQIVDSIVRKDAWSWKDISMFCSLQYDLFQAYYPESISSILEESLDQDMALIKLCGSGGGGYFIRFLRPPVEI